MQEEKQTQEQECTWELTHTLVAVAVAGGVVLALGFYFWFFHYSAPSDMDGIGKKLIGLGDYLGGVTTPWLTFLGLIALLYTIRIQSQELALSRKELAESREELAKTAKAQILSAQISAATVLLEHINKKESLSAKNQLQLFATDLDSENIISDLIRYYQSLKWQRDRDNN